jgi:hypothetical protein
MDPDADPDPAIFVIDLQDANKKKKIFKSFFAYYFLKVHLHHFKDKKSQTSRNQGFSYYFCLVIEGSGSIPLINGSGSGSRRPKNMWIQWTRIRNTGCAHGAQIYFEDLTQYLSNAFFSGQCAWWVWRPFYATVNMSVI